MTKNDLRELNASQRSPMRHPLTCGNDRKDAKHLDGEGILVAIESGWICPFCDYEQAFGQSERNYLVLLPSSNL